jgi:uncharacterized protein YbaP (TraB family)
LPATALVTFLVSLAPPVGVTAPSGQTTDALHGATSEPARAALVDSGTTTPALLWRIETDSATCYVFGTIHLADPRVLDLDRAVRQALLACDAVFTEIPLDDQSQREVAEALMLPEDTRLQDVLPADLVARIERFLAQRHQQLEPYSGMKPWVLASLLTLLDAPQWSGQPLDQKLYGLARQEGKRVGGLETVQEQIDVLDSLSPATAVALVEDTLDLLQSDTDALEDLVQAYLSGDENTILDLVTSYESGTQPEVQDYLEKLVFDRNVLLTQRMLERLQQEPRTRFFFAVGAGHLAGDQGVLARLARCGLRVRRVED